MAAVVALLLGYAAVRWSRMPAFDRQIWLANPVTEDGRSPRFRMVSDLRRRHLKPGLPRRQVRALLGPPEFADEVSPNVDRYNLGLAGWIAIDVTVLELHFDKSERLIRIAVFET